MDWPQSNQRGIETVDLAERFWRGDRGLNRTSVGLKPMAEVAEIVDKVKPQSNQRGIETAV